MNAPWPGSLPPALQLVAALSLLISSCGSESVAPPDGSQGAAAGHAAGEGASSGGALAHAGGGSVGVIAAGAGGDAAAGGPAGGAAGSGTANGGTDQRIAGGGGALDGIAGGAAGETSAGAGGAESGGAGGAESGGAESGGATSLDPTTCRLGCESNLDCASATAAPRFCDPAQGACVECVQHVDCVPAASGWSATGCSKDDDCFVLFGEVCVDVHGAGRCAAMPDPEFGCAFPSEVPLTFSKLVGHASVEVCGVDTGLCEGSRCVIGCDSDDDACWGAGNGDDECVTPSDCADADFPNAVPVCR